MTGHQKSLLLCVDCSQSFKRRDKLSEHYERFHQAPEFTKEGKIRLNASDQICLLIKGKDSWESYFKTCIQKKHFKDLEYAKRLQRFEQEYGVEFIACCDEVTFRFNEGMRSQI